MAKRTFTDYRRIALETQDISALFRRFETRSAIAPRRNRSSHLAPRSETETQLAAIWEELLRAEPIGVRDDFFELGGHSLLAVRLFALIEKRLGRKLPLVTIFQASTVEGLARLLDGDHHPKGGHSLLVPIQPRGSKPPLFLVHGAGGDVLWGYANLAGCLGPDQPVYGIRSRSQAGLGEFQDLVAMAECYVAQVRALQPEGPYYLGGYCFGGNIAYEMARQLATQGQEVGLVALLDAAPSNAGYETVTWWRPDYVLKFLRNFSYWYRDFAHLDRAAQRNFVARKVRVFWRKFLDRVAGARQGNVDLDEVIDVNHFPEQDLKLWQTHLNALVAHVEKPYPGRVVLLRTRGQPLFCSLEEDFCWSRLTAGGVDVRIVPGSHEQVFMEPHVRSLAAELTRCIDATLRRDRATQTVAAAETSRL